MRKELGVVEEKADKDEESKEAGEGEEEDEEMKAANEIDSLNKKAGTLQAFIMPIILFFSQKRLAHHELCVCPRDCFLNEKAGFSPCRRMPRIHLVQPAGLHTTG